MSRNASGVYTQPLPNVVTGDTIEAAWANTTIDDLETEMTDSLSRSGKGNMSVPFKAVAGAVGAPGIAFVDEASSGLYRAGASDIRMALAGAEFYRITTAGLRLASTDFIVGTSGQGVDFSANTGTAAVGATTTLEKLKWYEEGTWTPNLWDNTLSSSESQTYSAQVGTFTRIGRQVFIHGEMTMTSLGTLTTSQQAKIGPLPYTSSNTGTLGVGTVVVPYISNFDAGASDFVVMGLILPNVNYITLRFHSEAFGNTTLNISYISASGILQFSGSYIV